MVAIIQLIFFVELLLLSVSFARPHHGEDHPEFFGSSRASARGGYSQTVGVRSGPLWGSLSQNTVPAGPSSPISYGAGGAYTGGNVGFSGNVNIQPGIGGSGKIRGEVPIINNPGNKVTVFAEHERKLDRDLKIVGQETNSAGVNYVHKDSGVGAFAKGTHTPGRPDSGTIGANIPLAGGGHSKLELVGQTKFQDGAKPDSQVSVQFSHDF